MLLGGRIAEEIVFVDFTNGASNDIERATSIARNMVCNWGMSESLGTMSILKVVNNHLVMGRVQIILITLKRHLLKLILKLKKLLITITKWQKIF